MITLKQIKQIKVSPKSKVFTLFIGNFKSAFKGRGVEVSDIRPYVPGDNVKHIAWSATAKSGEVYVKEFAETRELNLHIALDNSSSMKLREFNKEFSKLDIGLKITYLLGLAANYYQDKFQASLYDSKLVAFTKKNKGYSHLVNVINKIVNSAEYEYYMDMDLPSYLRFISGKLKTRNVVIYITDGVDSSNQDVIKSIKAISYRHDFVIVDIYDLLSEENIASARGMVWEDIETGTKLNLNKNDLSAFNEYILNSKQDTKLHLQKLGVDYLPLDSNSDLMNELIHFFKLRAKRYGLAT